MSKDKAKKWFNQLLKKDEEGSTPNTGTNTGSKNISKKLSSLNKFFKRDRTNNESTPTDSPNISRRTSVSASDELEPVKLILTGGDPYTELIVAEGCPDPDKRPAEIEWYRATQTGDFVKIEGVGGHEYQANIQDVGERICAQWVPADGGNPSSFAQIGPLQMDKQVKASAKKLLAETPASLPVTVDGSSRTLQVFGDKICLVAQASDASTEVKAEEAGALASIPITQAVSVELVAGSSTDLLIQGGEPSSTSLTATLESSMRRDVLFLVLMKRKSDSAGEQVDEAATAPEAAAIEDASTKAGEVVTTEQKQSSIDTEELNELRRKLDSTEQECARLLNQNQNLRTQRTMLKDENTRLKQSDTELKRLTEEVATLNAEKLVLEAQIAQSKSTALADKSSHEEDVGVLKTTLHDLQVQLKGILDTERQAQADLKEAKAASAAYEEELTLTKGQYKSISETAAYLSQELATSQDEVSKLNERLSELQAKLEASQASEVAAKADVEQLQGLLSQNRSMSTKLASFGQDKEKLKLELKTSEAKIKELTTAKEDLEQLVSHLKTQANETDDYREKNEALQKANEKLAADLEKCKQECEEASKTAAGLSEAHMNCADTLAKVQAELDELRAANSKLVEDLQEVKDVTQPALEEARQRADDMTAQKNFFKRKADSLSEDIKKLVGITEKGIKIPLVHASGSNDGNSNANELEELRQQKAEMEKALKVYKTAFDQQLSRSRKEHKENMIMHSHLRSGGSKQLQRECDSLRALANSLSETLTERDEALALKKQVTQLLGEKVQQLEREVDRLKMQLSERNT